MNVSFSKKSHYYLKIENKKLKVHHLAGNHSARINRIVKMESQTQVDDKFDEIKEDFYIDKLSNGVYRVYFEIKDIEKKPKTKFYYLKIEKKNNGSLEFARQTSKYPKNLSGTIKPFDNEFYTDNDIVFIPDSDWLKLLNFYIVQNPSLDQKKNATTARYFNIKKYWGNNCWQRGDTLKTKLINTIPDYQKDVRYRETDRDMKNPLIEVKLINDQEIPMETRICIVDSLSNIFLSIFRHIRNALAHGRSRFYDSKGNTYIFLEDVNGGKVTARMVFDVSILMQWIDIIKGHEKG